MQFSQKVVYDCCDLYSPYYYGPLLDEYIRKEDLIGNPVPSGRPLDFGINVGKAPYPVNANRVYTKLSPYYRLNPTAPHMDETLLFESRFESGNLKRVNQIGSH